MCVDVRQKALTKDRRKCVCEWVNELYRALYNNQSIYYLNDVVPDLCPSSQSSCRGASVLWWENQICNVFQPCKCNMKKKCVGDKRAFKFYLR